MDNFEDLPGWMESVYPLTAKAYDALNRTVGTSLAPLMLRKKVELPALVTAETVG